MFNNSQSVTVNQKDKVDVNVYIGWAIQYEQEFRNIYENDWDSKWGEKPNGLNNMIKHAKSEGFKYIKKIELGGTSYMAILEKGTPFGKIRCVAVHKSWSYSPEHVKCNLMFESNS